MNTYHKVAEETIELRKTGIWRSIEEIPRVAMACLQGVPSEQALAVGKELRDRGMARSYLFGCGSSYFAALASANALFQLAGIDGDAYEAFEFLNYRLKGRLDGAAALAFSHTGHTIATVDAARSSKDLGALTVAFTDCPTSPLAQACDHLVDSGFGVEPVYPKTRSFISTLMLGYQAAAAAGSATDIIPELKTTASLLGDALGLEAAARDAAHRTSGCKTAVVVGGGPAVPAAMEIALKFKECVAMRAEAIEAEDALHGTLASLDESALVVGLLSNGPGGGRTAGFLKVAASVGCPVVAVSAGPISLDEVTVLRVPCGGLRELFTVPVLVVVGYLLVCHSALARGLNPDKPRSGDDVYSRAQELLPEISS